MFDVTYALRRLIEVGGSDLHLKVGAPALARVDGLLGPLDPDTPVLGVADTEAAVDALLHDEVRRQELATDGEVDFAFAISGLARFRVNAFRQRGSLSLVCRAIPVTIKSIDELALPPVIRTLAEEERGIVLLTGTTGSGKSTTLRR